MTSAIASEPVSATASGRVSVQDRRHDEHQDERQARRQPGQRKRPAQPPQQEHRCDEDRRQPEHRPAPLEVNEAVAGSGDLLGAGWRLGRLRHPQLVTGVDVRVEAALAAQLQPHELTRLRAGFEPHVDLAAVLADQARADGLLDALDGPPFAVDEETLCNARLDVAGP